MILFSKIIFNCFIYVDVGVAKSQIVISYVNINMENNQNIDQIILRHLEGTASDTEEQLLSTWLSENDANGDYFNQLAETHALSKRIRQFHDIDIDGAKEKVKSKIMNKRSGVLSHWQRIAAVIAIPVALSVGVYYYMIHSSQDNDPVYKEITASYGVRTKLNLPDGTLVWLNSGSSLKFPEQFSNNRREVFLNGEAFFEVARDRVKPFYVNLGELSVKALGTSFNVTAYPDEKTYETTLITGKVNLVRTSGNNSEIVVCEMTPNQHSVFDREEKKIALYEEEYNVKESKKNSEQLKPLSAKSPELSGNYKDNKYTSWIKGKLVFRNDPMEDVIKRLGRWYNVDIVLKDSLLYDYCYTATFTDETLVQVLDLLTLSAPLRYSISEREPGVDNSYSKRLVTIKLSKDK